MSVLPDWMIQRDIVIRPFAEEALRPGVISYGVSSYGYDVRVGSKYKVFTNLHSTVVDPKNFNPKSFVDIEGEFCIIPPNSFALAETVEYLEIPRDILCVCLGKCLVGDTRVVDATTGDYLPLSDFVHQQRQRTLALQGLKIRDAQVNAHTFSGVQPVYRLTTRAGLQIKATASHPFRTWDRWTPLNELAVGDRIAVARSCPVFGTTPLPEHEATLLGLLMADGQCATPGSCPRYTSGDSRLAEVLVEAAHTFGCEVSPVGRMGYNIVNHRGRGGIPVRNRCAVWLESLGCAVSSLDKAVPSVIFRAPRPSVAAFLRALFSGDGSVYTSHSVRGTLGLNLEYATSSRRLAWDVRHLLLRFGVFSLVRSKLSPSGRPAYRLQITDPDMIRLFAREIGFVSGSRKQQRLQAVLGEYGDHPRLRSNFDTLPQAAGASLRAAAVASGRSLTSLGVRISSQSIPYTFARTVVEAAHNDALAELTDNDVVWDTVQSIRPAGQASVYDLTVPDGNSFYANDFLVHNSTYARCGIIVNVTPLEPEWRGKVTIEISNTTPLPAKIYSNEGIAQILFFKAEAVCKVSYGDKKGKYQDQKGLTLPFVHGQEPPK